MRSINLTLKKQWFDLINHPDPEQRKKEEYRDIKWFWIIRFCYDLASEFDGWTREAIEHHISIGSDHLSFKFQEFDTVNFANGGHFGDVPKSSHIFKGFRIGEGRPEWGAEPGKIYFILELGDKLS